MKAIFRYDAWPRLTAKVDALASEGFIIAPCLEHGDERFSSLWPDFAHSIGQWM
jgi:hypothetical protein